jgi:hypothetical protein
MYEIKHRTFKKDTFVIYLSQLASNLIPMYMEPDLPWNVASCIFIPYMSVALGGNSTQAMHAGTANVEMPAYRYLKDVDLPTYDVDHYLPLINRGAAARFFNYKTQEEISAISVVTSERNIRVYDYDFQVHTRTDALAAGKFDITLPTNKNTKGYLVLNKNATYDNLVPHSATAGWNVATIVVADHGCVPFTVDLANTGRPVVGDGSNRTIPHALPANDDLIGVRIVEIIYSQLESIFKDNKLPAGAKLVEIAGEQVYVPNTNGLVNSGVLLSKSELDGWTITGIVGNSSGKNWKAKIEGGSLVVTLYDRVDDAVVRVKVEKDNETFEFDVLFSGEYDSNDGCNSIFGLLALLVLFPFIRKRA